ncbi:MAG: prolipoprotein diacylglyceryl transferase [Pseudomonadota bacterium]
MKNMLTYPAISPIALQIGPLAIRWYSLAYLAGILGGWWLIGKLNNRFATPLLNKQAFEDIPVWVIAGIILGGRLGYVCFYKPDYYIANPIEILQVWHGGMSFHGGLLGVITAAFLFARKFKVNFLALTDLFAVVTPIGLFFGRIANFINGELYGRITYNSPFAMLFPGGGDQPRHPSQLYEASLEGAALFAVLMLIAFYTKTLGRTGSMSGLFLLGYASARSVCELFREPDSFITFLPNFITMGQLLSLPMLAVGLYLVFVHARKKTSN